MSSANKTREIQTVAEFGEHTWFIELSYDEGDIGHAVGSVYARLTRGPDDGVPPQVLATNDNLSAMWCSPSGAVWVASASGHVATTAAVTWPAATKVSYTSKDPKAPWFATALPPVRATGLPANVTALWGSSDQQVLAGTYSGHIYLWDGRTWAQVHEGPGQGEGTIKAFGGGPNNVFAVGEDGVLLHFDGSRWMALPVPGAPNGLEGFTGVQAQADGTVLISGNGREGRLLHGTAQGLTELTRTPLQLIDLVCIGDRVLLATGDGVAELFGNEVRMIKSTFQTATAWPGQSRVFFIEPAQPVPAFIAHDPANAARPWFRRKH